MRLSGGRRFRHRGGDPTGSTSTEETGSTESKEDDEPVMNNEDGQALNQHGELCRYCELNDESNDIDPSQLCPNCRREMNVGRKLFARNIKMNGGTKLGMDLKNTSTSVGTVGAGHPGHTAVDHSADRPNQPANKVASSANKGGRRRRRTKNKRSRKMKKTKRRNRKTRGRKSHKKRRTRKGRKMRGGSLVDGCGCTGGGSRKRRHQKHRRSKKKGAGSCSGYSKVKKMKGGSPQPFSNEPMSFGYSFDGSNVNASTSALASPMPFKSYFACENVPRN